MLRPARQHEKYVSLRVMFHVVLLRFPSLLLNPFSFVLLCCEAGLFEPIVPSTLPRARALLWSLSSYRPR